jgi:predicted hydrocarbon binding protein
MARSGSKPDGSAGSHVSARAFHALLTAEERVLGGYHRQRISVQAGETLGRALAKSAKSRNELERGLISFIKSEGLGQASLEVPEAMKGETKPYSVISVKNSACVTGDSDGPQCDLLKGLIRGAYCAYLNQENVNVTESRCLAQGAGPCEFRIHLLNM